MLNVADILESVVDGFGKPLRAVSCHTGSKWAHHVFHYFREKVHVTKSSMLMYHMSENTFPNCLLMKSKAQAFIKDSTNFASQQIYRHL